MDFEIVSKEESQITGDRAEMYGKLERDLIAQVRSANHQYNFRFSVYFTLCLMKTLKLSEGGILTYKCVVLF